MNKKKIIYLSLILFIIAFFFVIHNRLSNGMNIAPFWSFAVAVSLTLPLVMGIRKTWQIIQSSQPNTLRLYLKIIPTVGAWAIATGLFFAILNTSGITGEMSEMKVIVYPVIVFVFILIISLVMLFLNIIMSKERLLSAGIIFFTLVAILLGASLVILLTHCGLRGCGSTQFLTKTALAKSSPDFCSFEKILTDDSLVKIVRLNIPLFFDSEMGSSFIFNDVDCFYQYAFETKDIRICDKAIGSDVYSCIEQLVQQNPQPEECEKLPEGFFRKSFCYFALAQSTGNIDYCENVSSTNKYDKYNRDLCYEEISK